MQRFFTIFNFWKQRASSRFRMLNEISVTATAITRQATKDLDFFFYDVFIKSMHFRIQMIVFIRFCVLLLFHRRFIIVAWIDLLLLSEGFGGHPVTFLQIFPLSFLLLFLTIKFFARLITTFHWRFAGEPVMQSPIFSFVLIWPYWRLAID